MKSIRRINRKREVNVDRDETTYGGRWWEEGEGWWEKMYEEA